MFFCPLTDGWEKSSQQFVEYESSRSNSVENQNADAAMIRNLSSDSCDGEELPVRRRALISNGSTESSSDSRSQNSSPVHRRSQGRRRARRALNRSCSVPDSNNPPAFSPPPYAPISMMMADLSDITEEENAATGWNGRLYQVSLKKEVKISDSERDQSDAAPEPPDTHQTHQTDAEDEDTCEDEDLCGSKRMSRSLMRLNVDFHNEVIRCYTTDIIHIFICNLTEVSELQTDLLQLTMLCLLFFSGCHCEMFSHGLLSRSL